MRKIVYILTFFVMISTSCCTVWAASPVEVLWYKMNDDAADTVVTDDGSASDNGELIGGNNTTDLSEAGKINDCLHYDGSADLVRNDDIVTPLADDTSGTVSLWIWADADTESQDKVMSSYTGGSSTTTNWTIQYDFGAGDDHIIVGALKDGTGWRWESDVDFLDGKTGAWYHLVVVHNGTTAAIWWQGADITASDGAFAVSNDLTVWFKAVFTDATSPADNLVVAGRYRNLAYADYFDGKVDDVRVYSEALTDAQIALLYNSGSGTEDSMATLEGGGGGGSIEAQAMITISN